LKESDGSDGSLDSNIDCPRVLQGNSQEGGKEKYGSRRSAIQIKETRGTT